MNVIEKLEAFQQRLVGIDLPVYAVQLQDIIEEAKKQEHVAYMDGQGVCCLSVLMVKELESRGNKIPWNMWPTKLFTHPQLSDETELKAKKYDWLCALISKPKNGSVFNNMNTLQAELWHRGHGRDGSPTAMKFPVGEELDAFIGEAMKAKS